MFLMDSTAYNALIDIIVKRTTLLRVSQVCFWYFGFWGIDCFCSLRSINWKLQYHGQADRQSLPSTHCQNSLFIELDFGVQKWCWVTHKNLELQNTSMCNINTDWRSPLLYIHMYMHNTTVLCAANGATMHYEYTQENCNLSGSKHYAM